MKKSHEKGSYTIEIDTEKLTVTATTYGFNGKEMIGFKAVSLKQAWWVYYNPFKCKEMFGDGNLSDLKYKEDMHKYGFSPDAEDDCYSGEWNEVIKEGLEVEKESMKTDEEREEEIWSDYADWMEGSY